MCLSRTVSETVIFAEIHVDSDFSQKSQNFPIPRVIYVPDEGVPLGIGYRRWESKN